MTTNQEARHQDLRDSTSTARGMTADWHALWDGASVADGTFNERLLAWINAELGTSYTNLPGAMHAYAADGGFKRWSDINGLSFFSPVDLFASSENGGWWDPSDLDTLYQERTGASATTPAGIGDPIGTVLDKSGNGNHLIAASDIGRPVLQVSGGLHRVVFDGVDDLLSTTALNIPTTITHAMAMARVASDTGFLWEAAATSRSDASVYMQYSGTANAVDYRVTTTAFATVRSINGVVTSVPNADVFTSQANATLSYLRKNGADVGGSGTAVGFPGDNITALSIGGPTATSARSELSWWGSVVIDRALTTEEIGNIENYYANKCGATLS